MAPDDVKLLMTGQHKASEVDKEYAKDPHRKAKSPNIRAVGQGKYENENLLCFWETFSKNQILFWQLYVCGTKKI